MSFYFSTKQKSSDTIEVVGEIDEDTHETLFGGNENSKYRRLLKDYYLSDEIFTGSDISGLALFMRSKLPKLSDRHATIVSAIIDSFSKNGVESVYVSGD